MATECDPHLVEVVLTAATDVHKALGPGLLESVYERALIHELAMCGIASEAQVPIPVAYKGVDLGLGFRLDVLVDRALVIEIKSVRRLNPAHIKQLLTYLRLSGIRLGFIINFNQVLLKHGIKRVSHF